VFRLKARLGLVNALHPVRSEDLFDHFAAHHNKHYVTKAEKQSRRSIWEKNMATINAHNAKATASNKRPSLLS